MEFPDKKFRINNLIKPKPAGVIYEIKEVNLKKHLKDILSRLEGEVNTFKKCAERHNKENPHQAIGFFSMVRIITPIVESVATALGKKPQKLLTELGVSSPYVRWTLYRDVLLHNDEMAFAGIKATKQAAAPGIVFTSKDEAQTAEWISKTSTMFDPMHIYEKLTEYLNSFIEKTPGDKDAQIISGILLDQESNNSEVKNIVREIKEFHSNSNGQ